jgi:DNA polymerase-3 subunit gamma/tau
LDQLIAGSELKSGSAEIEYDRAAALLGYTHANLLDEVIDAFATQNSSLVFSSVDKVIQSGQDPRRFVEDLLEKLRDLIVVLSVGEEAKSVLRGIAADELEKMGLQAMSFGMAELTHAAGAVANALTEMSGATSPKLQLELMCAKVLVPASDKTEVGSLARIERLERRMGVAPAAESVSAPVASSPSVAATKTAAPAPQASQPTKTAPAAPAAKPVAGSVPAVTQQVLMNAWPEIIGQVKKESRAAWMVAFTLTVMDLTDDVLTLKFLSQKDLDSFKADSRSTDALRKAIFAVLGIQVKFRPHIEEGSEVASVTEQAEPATTVIPVVEEKQEVSEASESKTEPTSRNSMVNEDTRYGESLLREVLGAEPIPDPKAGGR